MENKRKIVLLVILALAIGFAGISTMLRIGGQAKVGFDSEQFEADIIFTKSVLDEEDVSDATIIESGKKIRFETKKLTTVGESTVLDYTVTNKSNQYGARGHVKTFEYDPEYIKVENTPNDFDLLPQSNSLGKLTITLIKPLLEDKETEVIIEIEVDPIDPGDVTTTTTTETTTTTTEEIDDGKTKYDLVIDPDGGVYNGSSEIINTKVVENTEITLDEVTKEGYIFSHWEVNEEKLEGNKVTITRDITIKAVWIPISEAVARINEVYYLSIQSAFDAAKTNDEVVLLKDTEEVATNKKDIVFNLNTYKVTGSIANTGVLRIDNGEIENTNGSAINNTGTLTIGNNEGTVSITSPSIIGTDIGIEQKGTLNFYDGVVEGKIGINGDVAKTPEEYFVFVDHNDLKDTQKVYLVKELTRAVVKTITNGTVYYFNLQDGINSSSLTGYKIYAIRDFEAPYELNIKEGENITFDITGYTVELGNATTNNGTLTLIDSGDEKGELKPSVAITNNGILNVNNISISQTTDAQVVINHKDINIVKSTLTGKGGNALELMGEATLNMDDESYLNSNQWSLYLHDIDATISSGNIEGVYIETTASLTLEGGYFTRSDNRATINALGNLTINNGIVESSNSRAIYGGNNSSSKKIIINGGEIKSTSRDQTVYIASGSFEMNGGIIRNSSTQSTQALYLYGGSYVINGGIIYRTNYNGSTLAVYVNGNGTINNLEIHSSGSGLGVYGTSTINNINIVECGYYGIEISRGNTTINDGIVKGRYAIYHSGGTLNINGGNFHGTEYGIYNSGGVTNIGENDGNIKTTPVIVGDKYGVYNSSTVRFYDGIIKGVTDAANTSYNVLPDAYVINETEEIIDEQTYKVHTLTEQGNYLKVNSVEYNSLKKAVEAIEENGTIELISNGNNTSYIEIPVNKTITLDLNGYSITTTQSISNSGRLTIDDSSDTKNGKITTDKNMWLIINNLDLRINDGIVENTSTGNNARVIYSSNNLSEKKLVINGGQLKGYSTEGCIYVRYGNFEMNGGTIQHTGNDWATRTSLALYDLNYEINGGVVNKLYTTSSHTYEAVYINGNGVINNLNINCIADGLTIGGTGTINNINILGCTGEGLDASGNITINDGVVKGRYAIYHSSGTLNINGGNFHGTEYGIYNSGGVTNIGENDGNIKTTPVIVGDKYGVYNSSTVRFYDGIIKGVTDAANNYTSLADSAMLITDTETIDEKAYITNTLAIQTDFVQNGDKNYNNLKTAIDEANSGDTLTITSDAFVYYNISVPEDKELSIDLNGNKLTTTVTFVNNGNMTIKDNSTTKGGTIEVLKAINLINNNKILNLEDVSLINNISSSNYALYNSNGASTTLNNSNINGKRPINNLGYLEMNDSSVFSNGEEAITNNGDAELVSNNTNVNSTNDYSIYNYGSSTLNGGKYYGYSTVIYDYSESSTLSIMNATIGSENKPSSIYVSSGNMNLQESTIYGSVGLYATNKDYEISKTNFILSNDLNNKNYFIDNRSNLTLNDCTMQFIINNGWSYTLKAIYNVGTVNGNNNTITMKNVRTDNTSYMYTPFMGVDNTGVLNLNNTSINIDKGSDAFGIRTSGNDSSATLNDLHVNITNSQNAYGIYVDGSNVTLEGSSEDTIDVSATNAYGVYINGGSFTLGAKDESETSGTENASVSITNPLIKAVGTNTGIGVRKVNGLFNYYDGKIIGSTNASPDTTSGTEPYYEVSRKTDSESGYEYAILEYMR